MPKVEIPADLPDKALGFIQRFPGCTVERVAVFLGYGIRRRQHKNRLVVPEEVERTIATLLRRKAIRQEMHPFASLGDLPRLYPIDYQAPKLFMVRPAVVKVSTDPGVITPYKPQRRAIDDISTESSWRSKPRHEPPTGHSA